LDAGYLDEEEGMFAISSNIKFKVSRICDFKVLLSENPGFV
jgi:hypothetical protein